MGMINRAFGQNIGWIAYTIVNRKQTFIMPPGKEYFRSKKEASDFASKLVRRNLKRMTTAQRKGLGIITIGARRINI